MSVSDINLKTAGDFAVIAIPNLNDVRTDSELVFYPRYETLYASVGPLIMLFVALGPKIYAK